MSSDQISCVSVRRPWNKGQIVGQKRPIKPKDVWSIRIRLDLKGRRRDLALFNLAIDSKLRACDLVRLKVHDVYMGDHTRERATVIQKKTNRIVQFKITSQTQVALASWINSSGRGLEGYLFPSRHHARPHLSTRQYARLVHKSVKAAGLDSNVYGTHSMCRTKAAQIYRKTGNLGAIQLLLGHSKLESTVRYLGIEVDDALSISEQVEI